MTSKAAAVAHETEKPSAWPAKASSMALSMTSANR